MRVKALRSALDISQTEFARRCGIDREELSKIERGENKASSARIRAALAKAANVSSDRLGSYLDESISLAQLLATEEPVPEPRSA